jgi:hypothetical protein
LIILNPSRSPRHDGFEEEITTRHSAHAQAKRNAPERNPQDYKHEK